MKESAKESAKEVEEKGMREEDERWAAEKAALKLLGLGWELKL